MTEYAASLSTLFQRMMSCGPCAVERCRWLDESGTAIRYTTAAKIATLSQSSFGGAPAACRERMTREWNRVFGRVNTKDNESNR